MVLIPQALAQTIVDPFAFADGTRIDSAFTELRRDYPLGMAHPDGYDPFWVATRHEDLREIERRSSLFLSGASAAKLTTIEADRRFKEMNGGAVSGLRTIIQMDAPDHFKYRRVAQDAFLPANLLKMEARIRELARDTVDLMGRLGETCDFARDVALLYPLRVIMELLGVPQADEARMLKLTQEVFGETDPEMSRSGQVASQADLAESFQATMGELMEYFTSMAEDRRRHPRQDLASVIANGKIDGKDIGLLEVISYFIITATAGHDTTSNTTAAGLWALAENPRQFAMLRSNMSLLPSFIDESIRWATPVKHFMRSVAEDTTFAGQQMSKGDWMMLSYHSANRDEAVFDDPFSFDLTRKPNKQVAFGYGPHVCIGQHLARFEMRLLWEELLPRLESLQLDGTPTRTIANFVCGPKTLPIRYKLQ